MKGKHRAGSTGALAAAAAIFLCMGGFLTPRLFPEDAAGPDDGAYVWMMALPRALSGTLGEVRGYSFHSGIDVKTRMRTGYPVLAARPGRITYVSSSDAGYGNGIFLNHPDGRQSVYGHLESFEDGSSRLWSIVNIAKLLYNSETVELYFRHTALDYPRGGVIAYSGESGSGPPHLHYEVRAGDTFVNPLALIQVEDNEPPVIESVYVCAEESGTTMFERKVPVSLRDGVYWAAEETLEMGTPGKAYLKLGCFDRVNAHNSCTVYRITVHDGVRFVYDLRFDRIRAADFQYGRHIFDVSKSTIDGTVSYTHFLCRRPGNAFQGLATVNDGYIPVDGVKRTWTITAYDFRGNSSQVKLQIAARPGARDASWRDASSGGWFTAGSGERGFTLYAQPGSTAGMTFLGAEEVPRERLAEIIPASAPALDDILAVFAVRPFDALYNGQVTIYVKTGLRPDAGDRKKISLYQFFEGKSPKLLATKYDPASGTFTASTYRNGCFALMRDAAAPVFSMPPTFEFIEDTRTSRRVRLYVSDALSDIDPESFECMVDGESVPGRYDRDRYWVEMNLPRTIADGALHHLWARIADRAGNAGTFRTLMW